MTKKAITDIQEFLTVGMDNGDRIYQIVNVGLLLRRHPPEAVISFLQELNRDLSKKISKHVKHDKTNPYINDIVARRWRIKMAINTIRNHGEKEIAA